MQPQPTLDPMLFLALLPTVFFVLLTLVIIRMRKNKLTLEQQVKRWFYAFRGLPNQRARE